MTEILVLVTTSGVYCATLVLVPLGLPFFIPFALAPRWGLGYWSSCAAGTVLTAATIASYLTMWPQK